MNTSPINTFVLTPVKVTPCDPQIPQTTSHVTSQNNTPIYVAAIKTEDKFLSARTAATVMGTLLVGGVIAGIIDNFDSIKSFASSTGTNYILPVAKSIIACVLAHKVIFCSLAVSGLTAGLLTFFQKDIAKLINKISNKKNNQIANEHNAAVAKANAQNRRLSYTYSTTYVPTLAEIHEEATFKQEFSSSPCSKNSQN